MKRFPLWAETGPDNSLAANFKGWSHMGAVDIVFIVFGWGKKCDLDMPFWCCADDHF